MSPLMAPIKGQLEEKYDTPTCMMVEHYIFILALKWSIIENKKIRRRASMRAKVGGKQRHARR